MSGDFVIDCRDVRKVYGSGATAYEALRGVDFGVAAGEFVMLSGPSGSGKTTLLSIIGCVLNATSGSVSLLGENLMNASEAGMARLRLSHIGFVFQSHNLIASLSCVDNIVMLLEMRGIPKRAAIAEAERLLSLVELSDQAQKKPRDMSGGQRQRLAIARALAGSPPVILADEPTAALDAHNGLTVTETLRALAKEHGHTVVVVTHDNRIFHLADRIVHIEDGRILEKVA
jgi:putative ABC transport system ATP-binding protein